LFTFILFANMIGLLPFAWSVTNSFVVTFYLAFTYFFAINLMAVWKNGWEYCNLFLPSGVPLALAPLIVVIEIVSYYSRVFSLSIRLFANISSGHALLKILTGFSWSILMSIFSKVSVFNLVVILIGFMLPWSIVTLIFFLEFLIAFLQSYVFVILLAIYINDVIGSGH
jgi:F-type H+-transporting ATPase subunit a